MEWFQENMTYHAFSIAENMGDVPEADIYDAANEWTDRFIRIYEPVDDGTYSGKCGACGKVMYLDELDTPPTHCAYCGRCMNCGSVVTALELEADCCGWGITPCTYNPEDVSTPPKPHTQERLDF